jgi:phosphoserine aminotransferase
MKPITRPANPCFSSGPTAKRPGWSLQALEGALVGRSHRAPAAKARLQEVIVLSREILEMPDDHLLAIVPASNTGAFEMAMWSLLGPRPVDVLAFESFGYGWLSDIRGQLRLDRVRALEADYGQLPDLSRVDPAHDVVFTWNGTTSGVRVPDDEWIAEDREGLTLCDATSAAFAMELPFEKLDVVTWSWQKVLGGEAQHGMIALSPRAIERLMTWTPPWPLPKIFRMTRDGQPIAGLFAGETINTPSMLAVEDALDGLRWARSIAGLDGLIARCRNNYWALADWVARAPWVDFLALDEETHSPTSICLRLADPKVAARPRAEQAALAKAMVRLLEDEGVAYDIASYRDAPPGLRIWGGATVQMEDMAALLPWLDWAYHTVAEGD